MMIHRWAGIIPGILIIGLLVSCANEHAVKAGPEMAGTRNFAQAGRGLYLKNCAHCHADDATGDEGPDLHGLMKSDPWLANRIRNGKKGEMPAFGEKFNGSDVSALIAYLHTLE